MESDDKTIEDFCDMLEEMAAGIVIRSKDVNSENFKIFERLLEVSSKLVSSVDFVLNEFKVT